MGLLDIENNRSRIKPRPGAPRPIPVEANQDVPLSTDPGVPRGLWDYVNAAAMTNVPVVSDLASAGLAARDYMRENYPGAAANALAALPFVAASGGGLLGMMHMTSKGKPATGYKPGLLGAGTKQAQRGMIGWHGSPHQFDRFDMSKIGTGEGAQAYGHGLYFAESPAVAKEYKSALSTPEITLPTGEVIKVKPGTPEDQAKAWLEDAFASQSGSPYQFAEQRLRQEMKYAKNPAEYQRALDVLAGWESHGAKIGDGGALYKVDIPDEAVARMLDWDKPLSQQAPETIEALHKTGLVNFDKNIGPKASGEIGDLGWTKNIQSMSAEDFYRKLTEGAFTNEMFLQGQKKGAAQAVISDRLKSAGIPGIRYLDGGSRGAGAGTSNFVLFNDQLPRILEVNGRPTGLLPWAPGEAGGLLGIGR